MALEQNAERPAKLSKPDPRIIVVAKILIILIIAGLLKVGQDDAPWPIVTWDMYRNYGANPPPDEISMQQFIVVGSQGDTHVLWEKDLYQQLPSGDGLGAARKAFQAKDPEVQRAAFAALLTRMRAVLPHVDIVKVQFWEAYWHHSKRLLTPPFDQNVPDERQLIGSFKVADVEGVE